MCPSLATPSPSSQPSPASLPDMRHTTAVVTPDGGTGHSGLSSLVATFMKRVHNGTARSAAKPLGLTVGGCSNPTHPPATRRGVKPTNQASLKSLVVPVLPAAGSVNPICRVRYAAPALTTSASIVVIRNAVVSLMARPEESWL